MHGQIESYVANPRSYFSGPFEVVESTQLNVDDKRRILESWKLDAQQLAVGTAENMTGGEETDLREVSRALLQLDAISEPDPALATSSRGSHDRKSGSAGLFSWLRRRG
jgi:hypothetical protein